jgi:hypothetical protein
MRDCGHCVFAAAVWNGRPDELICVNAPGHAGRLTRVAKGQACCNFCARAQRPVRLAPPEPPNEEVRYIALTKGLFAIVDAADYEWLSQYKWCAGTFYHGSAYACCRRKGQTILMHRMIMNPPDGKVVDHINGRRHDNRRCNLRICTHAQNMRNVHPNGRGTSRFKGVCWHSAYNKWLAVITRNGKRIQIGLYADEVEAARAYDRSARELFGEYARPNFPLEVRWVSLGGRVEAHSRASGEISAVKSEARDSKSDLSDESETSTSIRNPNFETSQGLVRAFRLLGHSSFGDCLVLRISDFEIVQPAGSRLTAVMATGPPGRCRRIAL